MNFPSASPNENMNIDSSINPMPARRAERSSAAMEIFVSRVIQGSFVRGRPRFAYQVAKGLSSVIPGCAARRRPGIHTHDRSYGFRARSFHSRPGMTTMNRLSQHHVCDTGQPDTQGKSAMTEFDPALHRMVSQQRWFEDFVLGERFVIPSRTMTSAVFAAFQTA